VINSFPLEARYALLTCCQRFAEQFAQFHSTLPGPISVLALGSPKQIRRYGLAESGLA
jgi:hypothetical protein